MGNNVLSNLPNENIACPVVGYQSTSVCVPVKVTPFAKAGATITKCCGEPIVKPGSAICSGAKNGVCSLTISQTLCIEVPVLFGAEAEVGDTYVDCLDASDKMCSECENDD
jgi:hypothetical protein